MAHKPYSTFDLDLDLTTLEDRELFRSHIRSDSFVPVMMVRLFDEYLDESDEHEETPDIDDFLTYVEYHLKNMAEEIEAIDKARTKQAAWLDNGGE